MEHLQEGGDGCGTSEARVHGDTRERWSDAELVAAMRRDETGAFREFFARFAPLLTALARSRRLSSADLTERVTDFLDDAALRLCRVTTPVPRTLAGYLAASFLRRYRNSVRDLRCRERLHEEYAVDAGGRSERVIPSASSEEAVRSSHGPGWGGVALSPVIERLALALEQGLSDEERQLLAWLGARVPQREIAVWLGTTHGAMRVRITRMRVRLRDAAFRHTQRLDPADRAEVTRFLRRADVELPVRAGNGVASPGRNATSQLAGEEHDP